MQRGISEILAEANAKRKTEDIVAVLTNPKYNQHVLKFILRGAFDPNVKWAIPPGPVEYKPCPYLDQENMLYQQCKRLYLFVEGGNPNLTQDKRETMFIAMLESLMPKDAELMVAVKDKALNKLYKKITAEVVLQAYPGLF